MIFFDLVTGMALAAASAKFDNRALEERTVAATVLAHPMLGNDAHGFCVHSLVTSAEMPKYLRDGERASVKMLARRERGFRVSLKLLKQASADQWRVPVLQVADLERVGLTASRYSTCSLSWLILLDRVVISGERGFVSLSQSGNCGSIEHYFALRRAHRRWQITGWTSLMIRVAPGSCENYPEAGPVTTPQGFLVVQGSLAAPQ